MAEISFWGGVGVIGSSKVLIEQQGWRVLLDLGLDFTPVPHLFRGRVAPRPGHVLADQIRTGSVPAIPHLYRPEAVEGLDLTGGSDGKTALFLTHAHPDHAGLAGWVDPGVPIYASAITGQILAAQESAGMGLPGGVPAVQALPMGEPLPFGPFVVTAQAVDHDVPGAVGFLVDTEDGVVAYSGDIRLHGRHPEWSLQFAEAARGARALVIEGTTLSFGFQRAEPTEQMVDGAFAEILERTPGLVLMAALPANLERIAAFVELARGRGRTILWPPPQAQFLKTMGLTDIKSLDLAAQKADLHAHPGHYVVQLTVSDIPALLDLPVGPGSVFVHANGEPFGDYDPDWPILHDWLTYTHTPFWSMGTSGHASPADLHLLVETVSPDIVFPIHSAAPDRLVPPPGTARWLPERVGRRFSLSKP